MNKKKSRKRTNITPNKKLINIFLIIFLIAFLATVASYFTMKNKDSIKDIPTEVKVQEFKKEVSLIPKMAELKEFKDQASQELFEEKFDIKEEHKFEEYTKELEKVIDEKMELEESINKENEIIQKKIQEINSKGGKMDEIVQDIIELLNQCLIKTVDNIPSRGMDESTRKQISSFKQLVREASK